MKNKKGLTLIEIIIALAIIGILSVSFLPIFTQGFSTVFRMGHRSESVAIAQDILDKLFINPPTGISPSSMVYDDGRYKATRTVSLDSTGLFMVEVKVTYQNGQETVTLRSLVP